MAKRRRPDPFDEGSLRVIYERFFRRIVEVYCPPDKTHHEFMEDLFDVDHRRIDRYLARRTFDLPGLLVVTGNVRYQGLGYRTVTLGTSVLVRTDSLNPAEVQVDFLGGQGHKEHVYSLTKEQWAQVSRFLVLEESNDADYRKAASS